MECFAASAWDTERKPRFLIRIEEEQNSAVQIFQPVETLEDFHSLDEGDVLCGYFDGIQGLQCDLKAVSRAYWHGWRNGVVDGGFVEPDEAQLKLEAAFAGLHPK